MNQQAKILIFFISMLVCAFGMFQRLEANIPLGKRLSSLNAPGKTYVPKTETSVLSNDPAIALNWGLMDNNDATIRASKAWEITRGSKEIIVAVIDTGMDVNHPDLRKNLWRNPGETGLDSKGRSKSTNGIDDDKNGFIDDVHGWNFVGNNHDLSDNHGHGTHISGIIGAEGGNGIGISGVSPKVSIMVLKYYDPKSRYNNNLLNTIRAIRYANQMNAKIINYSGGGLEFSREEYLAVKESRDKGILFVAAAGNERSNSDYKKYYPADYELENIISVTALNTQANVLNSSNYGKNTVHIAAPGKNIHSTLPGGKYGPMTGTSQATAFVSGVASLIYANNSSFQVEHVRNQILATADKMPQLKEKTSTSGKLNSFRALAMQPSIAASGLPIKAKQNFYLEEETNKDNISSLTQIMQHLREPTQNTNTRN